MPFINFGMYSLEIDYPSVGQELILDGIDGFDDQTLWNYNRKEKLEFLINPNPFKNLLTHQYLVTEILEPTKNKNWAKVIVLEITTLAKKFNDKTISARNDFQQLVKLISDSFKMNWEMSQKVNNYAYQPEFNHFLTFNEIDQVLKNQEIEIDRKNLGLSKLYARIIENGTIRVTSVANNYPESCFIYDIDDDSFYRSEIFRMKNISIWDEEIKYWEHLINN